MITTKLNPWNWLKKDHEQDKSLPIRRQERGPASSADPLGRFRVRFNRMADALFADFGLSSGGLLPVSDARFEAVSIKPKVDVCGTDKEYVIEAELPGVVENDLSVELDGDVLVLSAEKRYGKKSEEKGYYRMERSCGTFRRVLNIPEDTDRDHISAKLTKGVLCVTMPRTRGAENRARKIAIGS